MLKPCCFAKSVLYPSNSCAKPHALYVDLLILNAVFQCETLFVFLIWIVPAAPQCRGVHGLDFGFLEPDSGCIRQDPDSGFLKRTGS